MRKAAAQADSYLRDVGELEGADTISTNRQVLREVEQKPGSLFLETRRIQPRLEDKPPRGGQHVPPSNERSHLDAMDGS